MNKLIVEASIDFEELLKKMHRVVQMEDINLSLCAYKSNEFGGVLIYDTYLTTEKRNDNDIICFNGKDVVMKFAECFTEVENKEMSRLFGDDWEADWKTDCFNMDSEVYKNLSNEKNMNRREYKAWENTWKYFANVLSEKTVFFTWGKNQDGKKICGHITGYIKCIYSKYNMNMSLSRENWRIVMEGDTVISSEDESEVFRKYYGIKE